MRKKRTVSDVVYSESIPRLASVSLTCVSKDFVKHLILLFLFNASPQVNFKFQLTQNKGPEGMCSPVEDLQWLLEIISMEALGELMKNGLNQFLTCL